MEKKLRGRALVLTPTRNLTGGTETEELLAAADQVLAQGTPRIVIDLGKVEWISSLGLAVLVTIHIRCTNRGGWMRLARVGHRIKSMLMVTKLILLFDTFDTVEEALAQPDPAKPEEGRQERPTGSPDPLAGSLEAALPPKVET